VLGDGWRGRAQTIVMLKTKLKRLESNLEEGGGASVTGARATVAASLSGVTCVTRRKDVDSKADEAIQQMEREKYVCMSLRTVRLTHLRVR
jgi:hypothetical protein